MKKVFLIPLIITLAVGLVFGGCGEPTTPTQPAPGAAPAEPIAPAAAPAEPITPIELSFASVEPTVSRMHKLYEDWANKVLLFQICTSFAMSLGRTRLWIKLKAKLISQSIPLRAYL